MRWRTRCAPCPISRKADRWVTLYCGVRLGKLLVEIQNPCAEGLVMRDGLPVSERAGHGYGCRSIQTIAERRGGLCEFRARGGIFSMQLVLPDQSGGENPRLTQERCRGRGGLPFSSPRGKKLKKVQNMAVLSKIPVIQ